VDVVIGLDSGTTATKAVAVGADASVRGTASAPYPLLVPEPGYAELDPAALGRAAVETLAGVAEQARDRGDRVVAVCLSAAMHGLVPLAADLSPLGPLVTWADGRAGREAAQLVEGSAGRLHQRTGTPVHPMSPLAKLVWWRGNRAQEFAAVPRWGGVKELIIAGLCDGVFAIDLSCASATGLYDVHRRQWDDEAIALAGVHPDQLAEVVPTTQVVGRISPRLCAAAGLPEGTPLVAGAADGPLANLGVGAVAPGSAAVSIGTSGALRAVRDAPAVDAAGRLFCYALTADRWVLGGAVNNGGSLLDWAGTALDDPTGTHRDHRQLLDEAMRVAAGSDGLLCLPYLLGERAPWWQPGLHAAWVGVRRDHGRGHLVRAAVEGVCQQLALVAEALAAAGVDVTEVRGTGGALESALWTSVLAACLDLPVRRAASAEGTGTGAGLLGHHALGALPDLDSAAGLVALDAGQSPDPDDVAVYRAARPLVEQCTRALTPVFAALDGLSAGAPVAGGVTR
jgi:gluconokinase